MSWWEKESNTVLKDLRTCGEKGLSKRQAAALLSKNGTNEFKSGKKISAIEIFFAQFTDFMVLVLIAAAGLSFFIGEQADFYAILAIVVLNAILGFIQEYRAERSMEALAKMAAPEAKVIRDGKVQKIPARETVVGDIILIEAGDRIPADMRIIESFSLELDESLLTGESQPVAKEVGKIRGSFSGPADLKNMLFMGTNVTRGHGKGVVVSTGTRTEMGKIAVLISEGKQEKTPLERRLAELGKWLVLISSLVCAVVAFTGWLRGEELYAMIMAGISLAVAAIPEGLPAIVTVALALGTRRMLAAKALIRRLPAVETLGCTTVICSDKTGTLTENAMTVRKIATYHEIYEVTGEGYRGKGEIILRQKKVEVERHPALAQLIQCGLLCNTAFLDEKNAEGDPTELALLALANKSGHTKNATTIREFPFDSVKKSMTVVVRNSRGESFTYTKGALETVLPLCTHFMNGTTLERITPAIKKYFLEMQDEFAGDALRVLACAGKTGQVYDESQISKGLILYGLVGIIDPPRREAKEAVAQAKEAGIRTIMITGDHPLTAQKIAWELGIIEEKGQVVTGKDFSQADVSQKNAYVKECCVFARVSPEDKLTIVRLLKGQGEIVAMTGDGVNDAPAVKEANIGVAMGKTGSDVTKEAAGMVLLDDNFATIVAAVREGRGIYENIRKFLRYLLGCNTGEVLVMFIAVLMGLPLPLLPVQILWMNLITDGLPAMALGVDKGTEELMQTPPRNTKESIFARGLTVNILIQGLSIALASLGAYYISIYYAENTLEVARTLAFTVLVFSQLLYVFLCRGTGNMSLSKILFGNKYLFFAVVISLTMHCAILYVPLFKRVFHTVPLLPEQWLLALGLSVVALLPASSKKIP